MKAFKIFVALLVMAVFVTAGSAVAGENKPFYEDNLYKSETSITGSLEQAVGPGPLYQDRYEDFLYETEKGLAATSPQAAERLFGIQPSWNGWE
jgi:hypothetical protein